MGKKNAAKTKTHSKLVAFSYGSCLGVLCFTICSIFLPHLLCVFLLLLHFCDCNIFLLQRFSVAFVLCLPFLHLQRFENKQANKQKPGLVKKTLVMV